MFETREILLDYLLTDEEAFVVFKDLLFKKLELSNYEKELIKKVDEFRLKYKRMPNQKELEFIKQSQVSDLTGLERQMLFNELLTFVRNEAIKRWVISVADKLEQGKVKVEELYLDVKNLVDDFASRELKFKKFSDVVNPVLEKIIHPVESEVIPTGIESLNDVLYGGVRKGEFMCVIAPPGRGKTTSLINFSYGALISRKNVLFLTLELSEEQIIGRFIRRIGQQTRRDIRLDVEKTKELIGRFIEVCGKLLVIYFKPHTLTTDELGVIVDKAEHFLHEHIDLIVIDYFDRMKMHGRYEYRVACGFIIDFLRDLAIERRLAVISATQANRASLSANVITEEYVSESFKKIENSDIVLSLNRTLKDQKNNTGKFVILKNREWGGVGAQIPVIIDWDRSYIGDIKHEVEPDTNGEIGSI